MIDRQFPQSLARILATLILGIVLVGSTSNADDSLASLPSVELGGQAVSLPPPTFADGMSEEEQAVALKQVAGRHSLDRFTKKSIVSPFTLKRETIKDSDGNRIGHRIDVWFVAHGPLDAIADEGMLASMAETSDADDSAGNALTEAQLKSRGIDLPASDEHSTTGYYRFEAPVLDRVIVSGVVHAISTSTESSHRGSVELAEPFSGDDEFPNRWRHAKSDDDSDHAYSGLAAYAKATRLIGHDGAIVIECHAVVHEPSDWFGGPNLLGSKLPLAVQDAVRKFRRALGKK